MREDGVGEDCERQLRGEVGRGAAGLVFPCSCTSHKGEESGHMTPFGGVTNVTVSCAYTVATVSHRGRPSRQLSLLPCWVLCPGRRAPCSWLWGRRWGSLLGYLETHPSSPGLPELGVSSSVKDLNIPASATVFCRL